MKITLFIFTFFYCSVCFCQNKADSTFVLEDFTKYPISTFSIWSGYTGCYTSFNNRIHFRPHNDSIFSTSEIIKYDGFPAEISAEKYFKEINVNDLIGLIKSMILKPNVMPKLIDFKISPTDKQNYLTILQSYFIEIKSYAINKSTKRFFKNVPNLLDTLNDSVILSIINEEEKYTRNTSNWFELFLINSNNDTLKVSQNYYKQIKYFNNHWMTPRDCHWNYTWTISLKGKTQKCSNFNFSKFIYLTVPNNFYNKEKFDNKYLIFRIGEHLYNKHYQLGSFFNRN